MNKVAVLYGGESPERDVSLSSGKAIIESLNRMGYDTVGIDAANVELVQELLMVSPDACFIALHGEDGENGRIQALLEILKIPQTSSSMKSSIITMDKMLSKEKCIQNGILVPKASMLSRTLVEAEGFSYPVVVKPIGGGSSFGISKVTDSSQLQQAYEKAAEYGGVMIEEWVTGKEITVAVLNDTVFASVWVEPKNEFYDYESKYSGQSIYHVPSGLCDEKENEVRNIARKAFESLECSGHARADFIYADGRFYFIEMNSSPGMTEHSLSPKSAKAVGYNFDDLVRMVVEQAK